jgi:UDP-GlcNAc3NAcA epimerase
LHIVGNRPQFIKLAVLHKEIALSDFFSQKIIHTGQHKSSQMNDIFFDELKIPPPDIQLDCCNTHPDGFIAEVSKQLQEYFASCRECIVFVYGDTNTTLAAAIASTRSGVPFFHFEAGIRTGDKSMPEEINRILTDRLAQTNYCCTAKNYSTMMSEGYGSSIPGRVLLSGDLMYDAFLQTFRKGNVNIEADFVVATIHRASNILFPDSLAAIIDALNKIHDEIPVIMPLHPHTEKRISEYGLNPSFKILDPVGYLQMQKLVNGCRYVITDSGGVSREAFFFKKKSIIIMENPFWPEVIEAGCSINVSPNTSNIEQAFNQLSQLVPNFNLPIFGDGTAAKFILKDLQDLYA